MNCYGNPVIKVDIKERQATNEKENKYKKSVQSWVLQSFWAENVGQLLGVLILNSDLMMSHDEVDI